MGYYDSCINTPGMHHYMLLVLFKLVPFPLSTGVCVPQECNQQSLNKLISILLPDYARDMAILAKHPEKAKEIEIRNYSLMNDPAKKFQALQASIKLVAFVGEDTPVAGQSQWTFGTTLTLAVLVGSAVLVALSSYIVYEQSLKEDSFARFIYENKSVK